MYRDDQDAMFERLEALDRKVAEQEAELERRDGLIAVRDLRIANLEAELAKLRGELIDHEATLLDAQRRRAVDSKPIEFANVAPNSPEAHVEVERLLAEGVERHRRGDRAGATKCFERGLTLVPNHAALQRALRRYT